MFPEPWQRPGSQTECYYQEKKVIIPHADVSIQCGIWIVVLVDGPTFPQFKNCVYSCGDSIKLC